MRPQTHQQPCLESKRYRRVTFTSENQCPNCDANRWQSYGIVSNGLTDADGDDGLDYHVTKVLAPFVPKVRASIIAIVDSPVPVGLDECLGCGICVTCY
jgi:hypothetical protein